MTNMMMMTCQCKWWLWWWWYDDHSSSKYQQTCVLKCTRGMQSSDHLTLEYLLNQRLRSRVWQYPGWNSMKNIRQKGRQSKKERRRNKSSSPERKKSSQIRKRVNSRKKTSDVVEQVSGSSSSSGVSIDDEYDSGEWPSDDNSEDKHNMLSWVMKLYIF